jgi:hypothetical protein
MQIGTRDVSVTFLANNLKVLEPSLEMGEAYPLEKRRRRLKLYLQPHILRKEVTIL